MQHRQLGQECAIGPNNIHQMSEKTYNHCSNLCPSADTEADEIEGFYASIQEENGLTPKQGMFIIVGAWNAKVGNKAEPNVTGKFGLRV